MSTMAEGDVFRAMLAGGGGWGDPLERDPARVLDDVLNEKVSAECARLDYGVVVDVDAMQVDEEATHALRERTRSEAAEQGSAVNPQSGKTSHER